MSGGVLDIICLAQITLIFVNHALIVDNRGLLLFYSENLTNLLGLKDGLHLDTNVGAQNLHLLVNRVSSLLIFKW